MLGSDHLMSPLNKLLNEETRLDTAAWTHNDPELGEAGGRSAENDWETPENESKSSRAAQSGPGMEVLRNSGQQ